MFQEKLNELIVHRAYSNTPWISLWERGSPLRPSFRSGQPLDHRLAE